MLNHDEVKIGLKLALEEFSRYIYNHRVKANQKEAKGQLITCIRRHVKQITSIDKSFTQTNIDTIHWNIQTGKLQYLYFIPSYGGMSDKNIIDLMNQCIEEMELRFEAKPYESQLNKIITDLNYYIH